MKVNIYKNAESALLLGVFILFSLNSKAQIIEDIGGVAYTVYEAGNVQNNSALNNREFTFSTFDIWAPVPEIKIGKLSIFSKLSYKILTIDYSNQEALFSTRPNNLQEFKSTIFMTYPVNDEWSVVGMALPSLASDFKSRLSNRDFLMQGGFAITKKIKSNAKIELGIGVFASYVFGELKYLPAFIVDYKSANNNWIAQAYWPRLVVLRNLKKDWQVGLAATIEGTEYNIQNYSNQNNQTVDYAEYSIIQTGFQLNKKIYKSVWLQLQSGYAFNNKYILFDKNNNQADNGDYSLDNLFYGQLLLTYRL